MNLYKSYKSKEILKKKEEQDRQNIGASKETVIIYEQSSGLTVLKTIASILFFVFCLALICAGVIFLALYTKQ